MSSKIRRVPRRAQPSKNGHAGHGGSAKTEIAMRDVKPLGHVLGKEGVVLWGMRGRVSRPTESLVAQLDGLRRTGGDGEFPWGELLAKLDAGQSTKPIGSDRVLIAVAAAHALPRLATRLSAEQREDLIHSLRLMAAGQEIRPQVGDVDAQGAWRHQMLSGELPLALAYAGVLDRSNVKAALAVVSHGLTDFLDGDGQLHASLLTWMRPLVACWTRSLWLARQLQMGKIRVDARQHFTWLVQQSLRWCRGDGATPLTTGNEDRSEWLALAEAGVDWTDDAEDRGLLARLKREKAPRKAPQPDNQSDWACAALLRSDWSRQAATLAISYHDRQVQWELSAAEKVLWSGGGQPVLSIQGRTLQPQGDWEGTCWESDEDLGYLELEMELEGGWRVQRQMAVVRNEDLLLVADVVLGPAAAPIEYRLSLPLAGPSRARQLPDATEVELFRGRYCGRIFPLAFPEWRQQCRRGTFTESEATWQVTCHAASLYFPLVVDLNHSRRRKPYTWRHLTVAENLEIVPSDRACAFRLQIGKKQWVIYRTLAPKGNRTFLGQNLSTEFFFGRFLSSGTTETLIEIE